MLSSNRQSVNVNRKELLEHLKKNLEIHIVDYKEAMEGYQIKLVKDLTIALSTVKNINPLNAHKLIPVSYNCPRSYETEYREVIDMMEHSVDEVIKLTSDEFKAYFKNEWSWSNVFNSSATMYKSMLPNSSN